MRNFAKHSVLILLVSAALAGSASAQGYQLSNEWGLFASYWDPKNTDSALGGGGKIAFGILPATRLDFRITYYDKLTYNDGTVQADLREVPVELGLQFFGDLGPMELFFGLGGGYYYTEGNIYPSNDKSLSASFDSVLGYYGNTGFEITLSENVQQMGASKATIYLDIGYRSVELENVKIGGRSYKTDVNDLSGVNANLGLMLHW